MIKDSQIKETLTENRFIDTDDYLSYNSLTISDS